MPWWFWPLAVLWSLPLLTLLAMMFQMWRNDRLMLRKAERVAERAHVPTLTVQQSNPRRTGRR